MRNSSIIVNIISGSNYVYDLKVATTFYFHVQTHLIPTVLEINISDLFNSWETWEPETMICAFGPLILSCYNPRISYFLPLCHITGGSFIDLPKGFQILKLSSYWVWEGDGSLYDSWEWQPLLDWECTHYTKFLATLGEAQSILLPL